MKADVISKLKASYEALKSCYNMENKISFDSIVWNTLPKLWEGEETVFSAKPKVSPIPDVVKFIREYLKSASGPIAVNTLHRIFNRENEVTISETYFRQLAKAHFPNEYKLADRFGKYREMLSNPSAYHTAILLPKSDCSTDKFGKDIESAIHKLITTTKTFNEIKSILKEHDFKISEDNLRKMLRKFPNYKLVHHTDEKYKHLFSAPNGRSKYILDFESAVSDANRHQDKNDSFYQVIRKHIDNLKTAILFTDFYKIISDSGYSYKLSRVQSFTRKRFKNYKVVYKGMGYDHLLKTNFGEYGNVSIIVPNSEKDIILQRPIRRRGTNKIKRENSEFQVFVKENYELHPNQRFIEIEEIVKDYGKVISEDVASDYLKNLGYVVHNIYNSSKYRKVPSVSLQKIKTTQQEFINLKDVLKEINK